MRTFRFFAVFGLYAIFATVFFLPKARRLQRQGRKEEYKNYVNHVVGSYGKLLLKIGGIKVLVEGREKIPEGACLLVGNHQSDMDVLAFLGSFEDIPGFIAKIEMKKIPLIKTWMEHIHCVFIDRNNARNSLAALVEAAENLRNGHSMVVFPEGTRSKSEKVGEFKQGSLKIAYKTNAPIVPFAIDGSYKAFEANKGIKVTPADIKITIFDPIFPAQLSQEEQKNLPLVLEEKIRSYICKN